jgi:prophage regulatory protein
MTRFLRIKDVVARTGLSEMTLWRRQKEGTFPRRVKLGPNTVGWPEEEIEAWCLERLAERDRVVETTASAHSSSATGE